MRWIIGAVSLLLAMVTAMLAYRQAHVHLIHHHLDVQIEQIGRPKPVNAPWLKARLDDAAHPHWLPEEPSNQTLRARLALWDADRYGLGSTKSDLSLEAAAGFLKSAMDARPTWSRNLAANVGVVARQRPLNAGQLNEAIAALYQYAPYEWYAWREAIPWVLLRWDLLDTENQKKVADHLVHAETHYLGWVASAISRYTDPVSFCTNFPLESAPVSCQGTTL